jgi:ComF family protein
MAMGGTVADVINTVLPTDCRICGSAMVEWGRVRVCEACVARVQEQQAGQDVLCTRCGDAMGMESARFATAMGIAECTMCRMAPPEFERAVAFANYDNEMREMLHLLKFGGMRNVAQYVLGERMASAARRLRGATSEELVVVPVPLFAGRERERGYNQAGLLAEAMVQRLKKLERGWKLKVREDVLLRVKDTRALYRLNPSQRRRDLAGAFKIAKGVDLAGREVLLVDDIMTTGATARACARALLAAGAARVWVVTAAKAQPIGVTSTGRTSVTAQGGVAMWTAPVAGKSVGDKPLEPDIGRRRTFT